MDWKKLWTDFKDELGVEGSSGVQMGMDQSKGSIPQLPSPVGGIMGPPPPASTQFTDVSQQGLMSPRTGQGPRDMSMGMSAGMPQMPAPTRQGLTGLMGMAPQQPQQQQEAPNTQGARMNEYLRGLLYG